MLKNLSLSSRINKRASTPDTFFWMIAIFALALILPIGLYLMQSINTNIQGNAMFPTETQSNINNITTRFPSLFDGILVFIFVMVMGGSIVLALFIDSNPAYFFISLFIMLIMLVVGAILANVFNVTTTNPNTAALVAQFPMTLFIMDNFVFMIVLYGFVISIVVYAKVRG